MRIKEELLAALADKGISVSIFPTEEAKNKWIENEKKQWEQWNRWGSSTSSRDENGNVVWKHEDEVEGWEEKMNNAIECNLKCTNLCWGLWYDSTEVYIKFGDIFTKRKVAKSFVVTEEWVAKVIEKEQKAYSGKYGQFAIDIQKMVSSKFDKSILGWVYPTTYGIGVWVFFNWDKDECIRRVREVLDGMNVEYSNEFSDAHYVYRFKISKKTSNRSKVKAA